METKTFISFILVTVLLVGTAIGAYLYGRSTVTPVDVTHTVVLPPDTVTAPAEIVYLPIYRPDTTVAPEMERTILELRAKLAAALVELAHYESAWAVVDTTIERIAEVRMHPGDSLVASPALSTRLQIRYGFPPINEFRIEQPETAFRIDIPRIQPPPPEDIGPVAALWRAVRDALAVVGFVGIAAGIVYIAL